MDEILALQQQLQEVQLVDSVQRLSEGNVVEIVAKLRSCKRSLLVYTLSGKEYLTPKQVEREVSDEILARRGRAALIDVASSLNLDIIHVEDAVRSLAASDPEIEIIGQGSEIITAWYLKDVLVLIGESLHQLGVGKTSLGEIAMEHSLPVDVITREIRSAIATGSLQAKLDSSTLYTDAYLRQCRAQVLGAFGGAMRPTPIAASAARHRIDPRIAEQHLADLVADGVLSGCVQQGNYVPSKFAGMQRTAVDIFFKENGFIELRMMDRLLISKAKALKFVQQTDEGAVKLKTCIVASRVAAQVTVGVDECVASNGWVNASGSMPSALSEEDADMLLSSVRAIAKRKAVHVSSGVVFSQAKIDGIVEAFKAMAPSCAQRAAAEARATNGSRSKASDEAESENATNGSKKSRDHKGGKGKKEKKRRGKRRGNESDDEREEEEAPSRRGKKSKRRKGKRRGDESDDEGGVDSGSSHLRSIDPDAVVRSIPEIAPRAIKETIRRNNEELRELDGGVLAALVSTIERKIRQIFAAAVKEALTSIVKGDTASRKAKVQAAESSFVDQCGAFQARAKNVQLLWTKLEPLRATASGDDDDSARGIVDALVALEYSVLSSDGFSLVASLMQQQYASNGIERPPELKRGESDSGHSEFHFPIVKRLSKCLPPSISKMFVALAGAASMPPTKSRDGDDANIEEPVALFSTMLEEAAMSCSIRMPKFDKKAARAEAHAARMAVIESVKSLETPVDIIAHATTLLIYKYYKVFLSPETYRGALYPDSEGTIASALLPLLQKHIDASQHNDLVRLDQGDADARSAVITLCTEK